MTHTRLYRSGVLELENFPVQDISDYIRQPGVTVWLDMCAPDADGLAAISEELDLHRLAVEDAVQERQRPKLDRYHSHLFVTAYAVELDMATGELETYEVAVFVTHNALVTVRKSDQFDINGVIARWDASPDLAKHGVSFLLHGLLDYVVDGHFTAVQTLDDEIETLEDQLFDDKRPDWAVQRRSFELRKSLVQLRRVVLPMREVVNSLMRRDLHTFDEAMTPYYQDVYDHILRATEWTESLRDLVSAILETNLTIQGNRLNVITKQVTSWAAIIAVPTAITGFYGQNVPYPGFGQASGFYASTIMIVVLSVGLYVLFRRRDWI
ncbi:MAG: magnesium transporter [Pseudonocardiales bacterium]|jgi:magnesium transporter|nr:corA [Pseudonocardiales bacterium]MDT7717865.1 magnesium transporter [Pseudonocardiales bacterium]